MRRFDVNARGAFEDLYNGFLALDFEDLTATFCTIGEGKFNNFVVGRELKWVASGADAFGHEFERTLTLSSTTNGLITVQHEA